MKLPLFPGVGLVVVALGALDLHAHEDPRYLAGHFHGLSLIGQGEGDGPVLVVLAAGRDHSRDDLVPRFIGLELFGEPVLEHVEPHLRRVLAGRVEHDHVAPVFGPVVGVIGTAEQGVDQPGSLVFGAVAQERLSLHGRRGTPGEVEVNPADIFHIGGQSRRLDFGAVLGQERANQPVELRRSQGRRCDRSGGTLGKRRLDLLALGGRLVGLLLLPQRGPLGFFGLTGFVGLRLTLRLVFL